MGQIIRHLHCIPPSSKSYIETTVVTKFPSSVDQAI